MERIIDIFTGERKYLEQKYIKLFGKNDYSHEIERTKRMTMKNYFFVAAAMIILIAIAAFGEQSSTGAEINFSEENGATIERPKEGGDIIKIPMKLNVLWGKGESLTKNVLIFVRPEEQEESRETPQLPKDETVSIESEISKLIKAVNRSNTGKELILPAKLYEGVNLMWYEAHDSKLFMLIIIFPFALFIIYQNRYSRIKKMEADAKDEIIMELPDFINKLVLLLNAGLVFTSAFNKILLNYRSGNKEVKSYFYRQLLQIDRSVRETNSPLLHGLKEFAGRSGVRELSRAINIISDNVDKGAELASKLQGESELLWLTKKKLTEERGRLAETKLTFPLVILLLALIMITVAPALMEM